MPKNFGMNGVDDFGYGVVQGCGCCGLRVRPKDFNKDLLNSRFINIQVAKRDPALSEDGRKEVVCIETKNGPLTIGMTYAR